MIKIWKWVLHVKKIVFFCSPLLETVLTQLFYIFKTVFL